MKRTVCVAMGIGVLLYVTGAFAGGAEKGEEIYQAKCKACHSIGDDAGPMAQVGGPLDGVGSKRDEEWLRAYLDDPNSKIEDAKMPKMEMPQGDWDAVVAYLLTLK